MEFKMATLQKEIKDSVITLLLNKVIEQDKLISSLRTECEIYKVNLLDTLKILLLRNTNNNTTNQFKATSALSSPPRRSIQNLNSVSLTQGLTTPNRQRSLMNSQEITQTIDSVNKKTYDIKANEMIKSLSTRNERYTIDNDNGSLPRELFSQSNGNRIWNDRAKYSTQSQWRYYPKCNSANRDVNKSNAILFGGTSIHTRNNSNSNKKSIEDIYHANAKKTRNFKGSMSTYQSKFSGRIKKKKI